jgi:hypothetical protein
LDCIKVFLTFAYFIVLCSKIAEDIKNKNKNIPAAESTCVTLEHDIYIPTFDHNMSTNAQLITL